MIYKPEFTRFMMQALKSFKILFYFFNLVFNVKGFKGFN